MQVGQNPMGEFTAVYQKVPFISPWVRKKPASTSDFLKDELAVGDASPTERSESNLSRAEMDRIVALGSNPNLCLPLEAKHWTRKEIELFVFSAGYVRPGGSTSPNEIYAVKASMSDGEISAALAKAAEWIAEAEAMLIGSGAGMGVDSGLGTFRGHRSGVWEGLDAIGLRYEEICDARWFEEDPSLAWAFWNHCHVSYRASTPHSGYSQIRKWSERCPFGQFSFTSNIDGHWAASGMSSDKILEVHGSVLWMQCSRSCCVDVWKTQRDLGLSNTPTFRAEGGLPMCPKCGAVGRPNVQMFGADAGFSKARRTAQFRKYDDWLKSLADRPDRANLRIVCLEIGCGLTVPTVRREMESVLRKFPGARIIRVNPESTHIPAEFGHRGVGLPMGVNAVIDEVQSRLKRVTETASQKFTLERALALQAELNEVFANRGFQQQLRKLRRAHGGEGQTYQTERIKLLLGAQATVLPRYGFSGDLEGVMKMLAAFEAPVLASSVKVQRNGAILEKLIE